MDTKIRIATREDVSVIFKFIKLLAKYEKMEDDVSATEEKLEKSLFDRKRAEVLIASVDNFDVGFMLFFHNFSTFLGEEGLYLEDYFVLEEYRNKGIGKELFKALTNNAIEFTPVQ